MAGKRKPTGARSPAGNEVKAHAPAHKVGDVVSAAAGVSPATPAAPAAQPAPEKPEQATPAPAAPAAVKSDKVRLKITNLTPSAHGFPSIDVLLEPFGEAEVTVTKAQHDKFARDLAQRAELRPGEAYLEVVTL